MESISKTDRQMRADGITSASVLLARVMWMALGPMLLMVTAVGIVLRGGWLAPWDAAFGIVLFLTIGGRWLEHRSGSAKTMDGEPATDANLHQYIRVMLPLAVGIWVTANVLGNYVIA